MPSFESMWRALASEVEQGGLLGILHPESFLALQGMKAALLARRSNPKQVAGKDPQSRQAGT